MREPGPSPLPGGHPLYSGPTHRMVVAALAVATAAVRPPGEEIASSPDLSWGGDGEENARLAGNQTHTRWQCVTPFTISWCWEVIYGFSGSIKHSPTHPLVVMLVPFVIKRGQRGCSPPLAPPRGYWTTGRDTLGRNTKPIFGFICAVKTSQVTGSGCNAGDGFLNSRDLTP